MHYLFILQFLFHETEILILNMIYYILTIIEFTNQLVLFNYQNNIQYLLLIFVKMISNKFAALRSASKNKKPISQNRIARPAHLKSSKNKNNASSLDSNTQKSSNKKRTSTSNSFKKKSPKTVSSGEKIRFSKQNQTPLKKISDDSHLIALQLSSQNKKGVAAIKNIKKKIIGDSTSKFDKQNKLIQSFALKQMCLNKQLNECSKRLDVEQELFQIKVNSITESKFTLQKSISKKTLTIQSFQFCKKLGKGRFGDVYLARDLLTGFALAIKMINKIELQQSEMQAQLIQQIKTQLFCNHPNIVKLYGFFADEVNIYLLLQYAVDGCLFNELRQNRYFSQEIACYYFTQVQAGVRYLHSHCIIHRDIKPQNIVNSFGVLKMCDFGWAVYSPIYQRQTFCGTLDYVSPQIVTGEFYDEKVDIWCLGVLCYQLCTGKPPFESSKKDKLEVYTKILNVQIQFPITMSLKIVDLIGKILHRDPKKRICLQEIQNHDWMRCNENEQGRMIKKQIWDGWVKIFS